MANGGTSPRATLLAPITAPSPTLDPRSTALPRPIHTSEPMIVGAETLWDRIGRDRSMPWSESRIEQCSAT